MPTNKKKTSNAASATKNAGVTVNWPAIPRVAFKPLCEINAVLESQILTLQLFSSSFTQQFLVFCQSHITPLLSTTPIKPKKGDAVRFNDRFQITDASFADMLWTNSGLKEAIEAYKEDGKSFHEIWGGQPVGLNSNIRIYRYRKGQFFDKHCERSICFTRYAHVWF